MIATYDLNVTSDCFGAKSNNKDGGLSLEKFQPLLAWLDKQKFELIQEHKFYKKAPKVKI